MAWWLLNYHFLHCTHHLNISCTKRFLIAYNMQFLVRPTLLVKFVHIVFKSILHCMFHFSRYNICQLIVTHLIVMSGTVDSATEFHWWHSSCCSHYSNYCAISENPVAESTIPDIITIKCVIINWQIFDSKQATVWPNVNLIKIICNSFSWRSLNMPINLLMDS